MANSNQNPPQWTYIIHAIGLAFFMIFILMGLIYILHGSIYLTAFISITIVGILVGIIFGLVTLKKRTQAYISLLPEYLLVGLYIIIFIAVFPLCFHFFNIDIIHRNEMRKACLSKLGNLSTLENEYKKAIANKKSNLSNSATVFYGNLENTGNAQYKRALDDLLGPGTWTDDLSKGIEASQNTLEARYKLSVVDSSNLQNFKQISKAVFENWQHLKVGYIYEQINIEFKQYEAIMKKKMPDFNGPTFNEAPLSLNSSIASIKNASVVDWLLSLFVLALIYLAIILPYIYADRPIGLRRPNPPTSGERRIEVV
ncbi:hypothetical protein [Runella sp. SP2]|uniref:hypothetical protein n=1 Tax=Runella sp. SP2 TaxID=2268026 RepID=UPI000F085494|nr:hypothetical protein [Runella sp. SP2]AYQ36593.1 hypothetical protein DTQ70_30190 [Runella sp. SP2]